MKVLARAKMPKTSQRDFTELASTEVIEHNRKMLAMTREAEQNQRSQMHSRKKNEQSL